MDKDNTQSQSPGDSTPLNALRYKEEWSGTHQGVPFKINFWGKNTSMNDGHGVWNYYVFLREDFTPNFESLWLEDTVYKWKPEAPGRITHDYYKIPASDVDWHGGVTYYSKHGHTDGYRCVELGCDYSHLWDAEAGYPHDLAWVLGDCIETINQLVEKLTLRVPGSGVSASQTDPASLSTK